MFKKTVNYIDFENGEEVEKEEVLRFAFTPPSIRLFESATGKVFFESYNKAFSKLGAIIGGGSVKIGINSSACDSSMFAKSTPPPMIAPSFENALL